MANKVKSDTSPGLPIPVTSDSSSTVHLRLDNDKYSKEIASSYNYFGKYDLESAFSHVLAALRKANVEYGNSDPTMVARMKAALSTGSSKLLKAELMALMGSFAGNFYNYVEVVSKLLPNDYKVWAAMIRRPYLSSVDIKNISGRNLKTFSTNSWNPKTMIDLTFQFFKIYNPYDYGYYSYSRSYSKEVILTLDPTFRKILAPNFLKPEEYERRTVPEDHQFEEDFAIQTYEGNMAADIAYLNGLESCGELLSNSGGITQARIASVAKKMRSPGFEYEKCGINRLAMLTLAFGKFVMECRCNRSKYEATSVADFARYLKNSFGSVISSSDFQIFFPEYKGFTKGFTDSNYAKDIIEIAINLLTSESGVWVDMRNIEQRYLFENGGRLTPKGFVPLFRNSRNRDSDSSLRLADEKISSRSRLSVNDWEGWTVPFLVRCYFFMAACGLVDLIVDKNAKPGDALNGMRYARLTDLGRYAIGTLRKYNVKAPAIQENVFEYDDRNSIITLLNPDSPFAGYLNQIGQRIGGNRFYISAASIIKNSDDKEDARRRIETFSKYICPNPEGHWLRMLNEAEQRLQIFQPNESRYYFYTLDDKVPGLIEFVANNKEIGLHSLKAEQNTILVEADFNDKFLSLLHKAGYLGD